MVAPTHARANPTLLSKLERRLKEVHEEFRGRVEPGTRLSSSDALEAAIANEAAHVAAEWIFAAMSNQVALSERPSGRGAQD
jgi:hypothetical protein